MKKKWNKIKTKNRFPKNKTFLLCDINASSGLTIYEAMVFDDGRIGCPGTGEAYNQKDFSHWRPMIKLPKRKSDEKEKD